MKKYTYEREQPKHIYVATAPCVGLCGICQRLHCHAGSLSPPAKSVRTGIHGGNHDHGRPMSFTDLFYFALIFFIETLRSRLVGSM